MGTLTDFFLAAPADVDTAFGWLTLTEDIKGPDLPDDPEEAGEAFEAWMTEQPPTEPSAEHQARMKSLPHLEWKGVWPHHLSVLRHLLLGTEITMGEPRRMAPDMSAELHEVPTDVVDALQRADIDALVPSWLAHEDGPPLTAEEATELARELVTLGSQGDGAQRLYLLVSG